MLTRLFFLITAAILLTSCTSEPPAVETEEPVAAPVVEDDRPTIVAFGDSISAGHGVKEGSSYPDFLQEALDQAGYRYRVVNAGVSGDTTSGGLTRAGAIAASNPAMVILELGGNDGLRGLPIDSTRANLDEMITILQKPGTIVVLAGMTLPPNYGPDYISGFEQVYEDLAEKYQTPLIPFLLEGVGGHKEFMQDDGIHPNVEGHRIVAENALHVIAPLLKK